MSSDFSRGFVVLLFLVAGWLIYKMITRTLNERRVLKNIVYSPLYDELCENYEDVLRLKGKFSKESWERIKKLAYEIPSEELSERFKILYNEMLPSFIKNSIFEFYTEVPKAVKRELNIGDSSQFIDDYCHDLGLYVVTKNKSLVVPLLRDFNKFIVETKLDFKTLKHMATSIEPNIICMEEVKLIMSERHSLISEMRTLKKILERKIGVKSSIFKRKIPLPEKDVDRMTFEWNDR